MKTLHSMFAMRPRQNSLPAELNKEIVCVSDNNLQFNFYVFATASYYCFSIGSVVWYCAMMSFIDCDKFTLMPF